MRKTISFSIKALWLFGPAVSTVVLSYFMLTVLTQGKDVLIIAGETLFAFLMALLAVTAWALLVWYSSRLIAYEKLFADDRWPKPVLSVVPRLLAVNTFISVQAAILALPTVYDLSLWALLLLIVLHNVHSYILYYLFTPAKNARWIWKTVAAVFAFGYVGWIMASWSHADSPHEKMLPILAVLLFTIQVVLHYWFVRRRAVLDKSAVPPNGVKIYGDDDVAYLRFLGLRLTRIPPWFLAREQKTFYYFNIGAAIALAAYLWIVNDFRAAMEAGPLAATLLGFGILVGVFNQLTAISIRLQFNVFLLVLFWAWFVGRFTDPYKVKLTARSESYEFASRPDLKTYFERWVAKRESKIKTDSDYPVYFVLADGGASRSGYWVASVLDAWQQLRQADPLSDHLFCLSGASGGGVGIAAYYTQLKMGAGAENKASNFLKHDFLSYCAAHMLGSDLLAHVLPLGFQDRADAIAHTMEKVSIGTLEGAFQANWEKVIDTTGHMPLLFLNTTRVQHGTPAVISSVELKPFSKRLDVLNLLDCQQRSLSLATAAVLGARFPYVSPAGSIGDQSFVDGGYFDNSGAGVVYEVLHYLEQSQQYETDTAKLNLYRRLCFYVVHITNSLPNKKAEPIHPLANDLTAPLLTVFNTYSAQTEVNDERLQNLLRTLPRGGTYHTVNLYTHDPHGDYPMNWVISTYRLKKIDTLVAKAKACELRQLPR